MTEFRGWEYGDEDGYTLLLTKDNLFAFLRYRDEQEQQKRDQYANEAESWDYRQHDPEPVPPPGDNSDGGSQPAKDDVTKDEYRQAVNDKLLSVKEAFKTAADFEKAVAVIVAYFFSKQIPKKVIAVKNGWKKKIAFALGEVHRELKPQTTLDINYLLFYTKAISAFEKDVINESNVFGDKLYKYSISIT